MAHDDEHSTATAEITADTTARDVMAADTTAAVGAPWLAAALAGIGVGAIAVALLGPLGTEVIDYRVSAGAVEQVRGGDVAGLVLVGPASLAAGWLVHRNRRGAHALALAPAAYGLYMYSQLAISGDVVRYPGNAERFFPLFVGLVVLCGLACVAAATALLTGPDPAPRPRLEQVLKIYLSVVALFLVVGLHLPGLREAWRDPPTNEEYLADPVVFWVVKLMDLGFVVPVMAAVALGLHRGRSWARRLMAPVVEWCALLGASVAGMGVAMLAAGSPGAGLGLVAGFLVAAAGALTLAVAAYRPLLRRPTGPRR